MVQNGDQARVYCMQTCIRHQALGDHRLQTLGFTSVTDLCQNLLNLLTPLLKVLMPGVEALGVFLLDHEHVLKGVGHGSLEVTMRRQQLLHVSTKSSQGGLHLEGSSVPVAQSALPDCPAHCVRGCPP